MEHHKQRCIRIEIEFENGLVEYAHGDSAMEAWSYIESAQVLYAVHGAQYIGPPLERFWKYKGQLAIQEELAELGNKLRETMANQQDQLDALTARLTAAEANLEAAKTEITNAATSLEEQISTLTQEVATLQAAAGSDQPLDFTAVTAAADALSNGATVIRGLADSLPGAVPPVTAPVTPSIQPNV